MDIYSFMIGERLDYGLLEDTIQNKHLRNRNLRICNYGQILTTNFTKNGNN